MLNEIEKQYPEKLKKYKRNILREYLQYKILEIIFDWPLAGKLSFLGGTALRVIYNNNRFSENSVFDHFSLEVYGNFSQKNFKIFTKMELSDSLMIRQIGYNKFIMKGAITSNQPERERE